MCGQTTPELYSGCENARKLQLRQELTNLRQRDLSVADYTSRIKDICDSLVSIDVNIEEKCLASKFGAFRTAVCTRENTPSFFDLQSMLLVEENHAGVSKSTHTNIKMLYVEEDRPRGGGGRGWSACNRGVRKEQDRRHNRNANISSGPSGSRGVKVAPKTGKESP